MEHILMEVQKIKKDLAQIERELAIRKEEKEKSESVEEHDLYSAHMTVRPHSQHTPAGLSPVSSHLSFSLVSFSAVTELLRGSYATV
jgi:hypothetical protein